MTTLTTSSRFLAPAWRRSAAMALGCAVSLVLASCSSPSGDSANAGSGGNESDSTKIKVGVFPLLQAAVTYHAMEKGLFDEAGIDLEVVETAGGAQTIPSMLAGDFDAVYANYTTAVLAAQQGLPVRIACGNDVGADDHALIVDETSQIQKLSDLEDTRIAVNNLQNIGMVAINALLEDAGVDRSSVTFLELPFPDMQGALDAGDVDVIWQVEPFKASALDAGNRELSPLFVGPVEGMPVAGWLTTESFAQENAGALESFCEALGTSAGQVQGDRERLVELVPTYSPVPAEVVEQVSLPHWDADIDEEGLQKMADLMLEFEIIDEPFDVHSIIVSVE